MGFVSLLVVALRPVVEVLLVSLLGSYLASGRCNLLTASARSDINRVVYAVFTPALMVASLARTVTLQDAISWWFMPVNIGILFLTGGVLGWVAVLLLRPPQHVRGLVVASCSAANLGFLLLTMIPAVCREDGNPFAGDDEDKGACAERGVSYASFSLALGGLYIWTHTHSVMKRSSEICRKMVIKPEAQDSEDSLVRSEEEPRRQHVVDDDAGDEEEGAVSLPSESSSAQHPTLLTPLLSTGGSNNTSSNSMWDKLKHGAHQIVEGLTAPPTAGAVLGLIVGAVPWLRSTFVGDDAPLRVVQESLKLLGDGTVPCLILILGGNLTKGVGKTTMSPWVIVAIICVRFVILPVVGIVVVMSARELGFLPPDPLYQYVLMLQFAMPPAMTIGTMAHRPSSTTSPRRSAPSSSSGHI